MAFFLVPPPPDTGSGRWALSVEDMGPRYSERVSVRLGAPCQSDPLGWPRPTVTGQAPVREAESETVTGQAPIRETAVRDTAEGVPVRHTPDHTPSLFAAE